MIALLLTPEAGTVLAVLGLFAVAVLLMRVAPGEPETPDRDGGNWS